MVVKWSPIYLKCGDVVRVFMALTSWLKRDKESDTTEQLSPHALSNFSIHKLMHELASYF